MSTNAANPREGPTTALLVPAALRAPAGGPSGLFLSFAHQFALAAVALARSRPEWRVATRMYEYRILDHNHEELLVYHWQPEPDFAGSDYPHVHISATLNAQVDAMIRRMIDLDRLHVATGRVSLAEIIRMLITEFTVAPQRHDWRETLDRTESVLRDLVIE